MHGYMNVPKRSQDDIIYLITTFEKVKEFELPYVYFDGHGYHNFSQIYNSEDGLNDLDWNTINTRRWFDTEDDPDRKRRKQAEFLIHQEMPIEAIHVIGVNNLETKERVEGIRSKHESKLEVIVFKNGYY